MKNISFGGRLAHAWNAFVDSDKKNSKKTNDDYYSTAFRSQNFRAYQRTNTIITAIYSRIALDVSLLQFNHVRVDANNQFLEAIPSGLNECLSLQANIDQTANSFMIDLVLSLFDEGAIAIVPVDTTLNPRVTNSYDIQTMRVGHIKEWFAKSVRAQVYNDQDGQQHEVMLPKSIAAIIQNPLYSVINEPNGTLQRLLAKLRLLDITDDRANTGQLDMIIQLPYALKTELMRSQAEQRRQEIEMQMSQSKLGIAYIGSAEKITQLNRPVASNLLPQIENLTNELYAELGITANVLNGTASDSEMLNYYTRTIEPIAQEITQAMTRTFMTKTARTQGQAIRYFRDPFKLVPVSQISDISNSLSRNAILSANEFRQILGFKPSSDPKSDQLVNNNMPAQDQMQPATQ